MLQLCKTVLHSKVADHEWQAAVQHVIFSGLLFTYEGDCVLVRLASVDRALQRYTPTEMNDCVRPILRSLISAWRPRERPIYNIKNTKSSAHIGQVSYIWRSDLPLTRPGLIVSDAKTYDSTFPACWTPRDCDRGYLVYFMDEDVG